VPSIRQASLADGQLPKLPKLPLQHRKQHVVSRAIPLIVADRLAR
jgi:hypothetical protein